MRDRAKALVLAVAVAGTVVSCGAGGGQVATFPTAVDRLHITRTPGLFALPPLDREISDSSAVGKLAADIQRLPLLTTGVVDCPVDFGTAYQLAFGGAAGTVWSAVVDVSGCRAVSLSNGPTRSALNADAFFTDLAAAVGLTQVELIPVPCPSPTGGLCYPQRAPRTG